MPTDDTRHTHPALQKSAAPGRARSTGHAPGATNRPESPALEGREPLPPELTGRASGTDEDLVALFENQSGEHVADGFRGGSQDVPGDGTDATTEKPSTEGTR